MPGGRVEPGETLAEAVEREVAEETALAVRCGPFVGWVERIGATHHFVIMDFQAELIGTDEATAGDLDPSPVSGRQEMLENHVNEMIWSVS